jgi:hypothetical protein
MQDTQQQLPALDEYVDLRSLLPTVKDKYPSADSLKWFTRQHRDELAAAGALIIITGRLLFHPSRFSQAAVAIGRNAARINRR